MNIPKDATHHSAYGNKNRFYFKVKNDIFYFWSESGSEWMYVCHEKAIDIDRLPSISKTIEQKLMDAF